MKTKEELTAVKEKAEAMNEKVRKLTDVELRCSGGAFVDGRWQADAKMVDTFHSHLQPKHDVVQK